MRLIRNICIVLNLFTGVLAAARHDVGGVILSTMLIGGMLFVSKLEEDHSGK